MSGTSFNDLRRLLARDQVHGTCDETGVRRLWWAALETLQQELLSNGHPGGLWLAAPLPALYEPELLRHLNGWVWAPESLDRLAPGQTALPAAGREASFEQGSHFQRLPLQDSDGQDPFLLVITPTLQLALALIGDPGQRQLLMRSDPETLTDALALLGHRLQQEHPLQAETLAEKLADLGPLHSDDELQQRFWPRLAERLATTAPSLTLQTSSPQASSPQAVPDASDREDDLSLLEALTHEVRTPLATIRTLIRSLLRRRDLPSIVQGRLRQIDVECSEQIDRFGLIFHAAELQRQPQETSLARTDLETILRSLAPGWGDQLERRGIGLVLDLEAGLPPVLSDPRRLEPMLGGLIDRSGRGLPAGSQLILLLRAAGARLKLQLLVESSDQSPPGSDGSAADGDTTEQVGPVLSWDPTTGSLQLSQQATRQLLASLGGRYHARRERELTVFFPVAEENG
ncbi:putative two component signal transduction histidine kinase [Synechococcus sp. A15-127]|uniref:sensor histidine kinase n=1 Tax=Synechococcus sp. A15-127 TaxID=1050624 RepID=UPI001648AE10|nr:HAMP domain-containing histidine kinase [Synechococcus sp. A15-127]QNI93567.1 putative two component signal transduction histidine kinase [Synechococcus sp. A15-127]